MSRPLYARMLRLRYLAPSGFLCFVFLEGAVALGFLLALAELVSWWGVVVLPIAVALMVKLNDAVTGALIRPAPDVAPLGRVAVAPTVPMQRPPAVVPQYAGQWPGVQWSGTERVGVERLDVWQTEVWQPRVSGPDAWQSDARPAAVSPAAVSPAGVSRAVDSLGATGEPPGNGEVSPGRGWTAEPRRPDGRSGAATPAVAEAEVTAINGSPSTRQWMDQIDTGQRLRQSANRRYE
jgi:hypothetical protein